MKTVQKKIAVAILIAFTCFVVAGCQSITGTNLSTDSGVRAKVQEDYWPTDEWRTSTPEEQGMDSKLLADMLDNMENGMTRSVLVIRHGYVVLESYRYPYDRVTALDVRSVSKSFMSALTGIAVREKYIKSIDQKVSDFLPEYFENTDQKNKESLKKDITIKHLLTMTAGLKTSALENEANGLTESNDWLKLTVDQPLIDTPGRHFNYNTGLTHLMSGVITSACGMDTYEFAKKYLFDPLGISDVRWPKDPHGTYVGGNAMEFKSIDLAKFGYLYLHKGKWNGQQILQEEWVESSVTNHVSSTALNELSQEYGYWWWLDKDFYFAYGWGGQFIFVDPKLDMVAVITGINQAGGFELYKSKIRAAVKSNAPLKPNPSAVDRMNKGIDKLANPKNEYAAADPELIERISGKTFKCAENQIGLDFVSFTFNGSDCIFKYKQTDPEGNEYLSEFPVGLNGRYKMTPIEARSTYFGTSTNFFPVNEPGGPDKYPVAFEGHWVDKSSFTLKSLWPFGLPANYRAVFNFEGDKVTIRMNVIPTPYQFVIEGSLQ